MPGCFELDKMFHLLIGRASSSTASIHKNDLLKREATWIRILGSRNPNVPNCNLSWPYTNKEHKKETTSSMAPSTSGSLKTVHNAYDTGCWDVTDLRSNPQSIRLLVMSCHSQTT